MSATYSLDNLKQKLQNSPYKFTHQRKVVLEVFVDNPGVHLSAEEVHDILKQKAADIGLATVYRALELLCSKEIGILQKIDFGDGCSRYELNLTEPNSHQHHHMICTNCKKVIEFSEDMLDDLEADIMKKCGFKVTDHQVKFFGLCEECRKEIANSGIFAQQPASGGMQGGAGGAEPLEDGVACAGGKAALQKES